MWCVFSNRAYSYTLRDLLLTAQTGYRDTIKLDSVSIHARQCDRDRLSAGDVSRVSGPPGTDHQRLMEHDRGTEGRGEDSSVFIFIIRLCMIICMATILGKT